jgi:site-specific DNA recombinase
MSKTQSVQRALIYARVSTDKQRENYSIPVQLESCHNYIEKKNYVLVGENFVDPVTGKNVPKNTPHSLPAYVDDHSSLELNRPSLNDAIEYVAQKGAEVVVVYVLDRFARDSYIRQTLEHEFERLGAKIEYVLGDYDNDVMGDTRKDLDDLTAKIENRIRTRRSREGKLKKARSGKYAGSVAQYGYKLNKEAVGGLEIAAEEAAIVERIFNSFVFEKKSIRSIVSDLNTDLIPGPTGKHWSRSGVARILKYEGYTGVHYYNKQKVQRTLSGKIVTDRDESEWIQIETPVIISPQVFKLAQQTLKDNKNYVRGQPKVGRFYMLGGMIFCSGCKRPYISQTVKAGRNRRVRPTQIYRHRKSEGHCTNKTLSATAIDNVIWQRIAEIVLEPTKLLEGYKRSLESHWSQMNLRRDHLQSLHHSKLKIEQKQRMLLKTYLDVDIGLSKSEYLKMKGELDSELEKIRADIEEVEGELRSVPTPADLATFEAFTAEIREFIEGNVEPLAQEKRRLLQLMNVKVWVNPENWEISLTGSFHGKDDAIKERDGLLNSSSSNYALRPPQPPSPV